jgi:hypothetical protein
MKFKFSISKADYAARLAEMEEWLHSIIEYQFGWVDEDHYYIIVGGLDENDAIVYSLRYKLSIIKVGDEG